MNDAGSRADSGKLRHHRRTEPPRTRHGRVTAPPVAPPLSQGLLRRQPAEDRDHRADRRGAVGQRQYQRLAGGRIDLDADDPADAGDQRHQTAPDAARLVPGFCIAHLASPPVASNCRVSPDG
ncbi:hypothetical protein SI859A1_01051 [Aurantimonas manganoxydans SI85-9A1]|uniref:Uncharacterized protein n=1 Tax=Aurantimonas manganoxydans (strain ATCC BAA-1229 / DSM 21871 / SI85-9A1) TaxID=287752 RepID=Q1YJE8_AURMS|nr:hypothetical protein SI859A1_01051 [Aurantimonas manganoxydans SI85-9A1]